MSNIVAIVGRPNVGKSTLFNRLTGERIAIVDPTSGVTRDRHYGKSDWNGIEFSVIDTGGYVVGSEDVFEEEIRKQVDFAIDEADVILFLLDVAEGLNVMDVDVAEMLRKSRKKVIAVVNKVDNAARMQDVAEFYALGFDQLFPISGVNGGGTGELLDELVKEFKPETTNELDDIPRFAVVGRPNVGKSSLVNVLLGEERNIVTPVAGTTRDSIYSRYNLFGFDFFLVDTAGLRKKNRVYENIEFYSSLRSIRAIEHSDVCILMIDATEGFGAQDQHILSHIEKNHKGLVIVVNKWDLVEKSTHTHKEFETRIREKTAPFTDIPILFTSTISKQRIFKALETAMEVYKNRTQKISTSKLNEMLLPIIEQNPPPSTKGKHVKIKYITQLPLHYPAFAFFCNLPQYIKDPYKRFLENQLRKQFDFSGVPLIIYLREK
jgi:GTP-binding protein